MGRPLIHRRVGRPLIRSANREPVLVVGDLVIDRLDRIVTSAGRVISLEPLSFDLLVALASSPGEVVSFNEIGRRVWGEELGPDVFSLRVHIHRLRHALYEGKAATFIETERGVGYRLVERATIDE